MNRCLVVAPRRMLCVGGLALCVFLAGTFGLAQDDRDQWQQPHRVMADLGLKPGATVADVGCGGGYFTFRLRDAVGERGKVFAVDVDPAAVEAVRKAAEQAHLSNIEVILSEPTDTKLQPESIEVCLVCDVLHEVPADARLPLVRNIARALKPGGFFFLIDYRKAREVPFDPYDRLIPHDDLAKLGTDAGLSLDAEFHYLKYQVFLRFRKPQPALLSAPPPP